MRSLPALSAALLLILLPCCSQMQDDCTIEDVRFHEREQAGQQATLTRLMACMEGHPQHAGMDADELAEQSALREGSTCGFIPLETLEAAEEAYLALEPYERIRLATDVMDALLASPTQLMGESMACKPQRVHSYQELDVSPWRADGGEFFTPSADEREDFIRTALFKRMVARLMLEDVACNEALGGDVRCAAVECLRHICLDGLLEADGSWDSLYIIDALPLHGKGDNSLETALFGGPAWEAKSSSN